MVTQGVGKRVLKNMRTSETGAQVFVNIRIGIQTSFNYFLENVLMLLLRTILGSCGDVFEAC